MSPLRSRLWRRVRSIALMLACLLVLGLVSCTPATPPSPTKEQIKEQVLQIVRENPDVLVEALQAYERDRQQAATLRQQVFQQLQAKPDLIVRDSPTTGAVARKIVLAEFSDFQCPFCGRSQATLQQFMDKHGDRVTLTFKHFPLKDIHPQAMPAALAAWAAQQQGKFWEYHAALFAHQDRLGEALYGELAAKFDLDRERFDRDRQSDAAKAAVEKDLELGRSLGISGTPTFVMNGIGFAGAVELAQFEEVLAQVDAQSSP